MFIHYHFHHVIPVATEGVTNVQNSSTFYIYAPVSMHHKGAGVSQETVERLYQEFFETIEACPHIEERISNHSLYTTSHVESDRCLTTIPGKLC